MSAGDNNYRENGNSTSNRGGGWGKVTVAVIGGLLLVSTLIIAITLPLSSSSLSALNEESEVVGRSSSMATTTATTPNQNFVVDAKGSGSKAEVDRKSDFELYGRTSSANETLKEITLIAQEAELEIAPGKVVKTWTFNGTMPSPSLRFTEGDNVRIKFINKTPLPHTLHLHGNHDDANDGVLPQIMPNQSYIYNITAGPAGALMYHCHAHPTSLHIRMGMYGAMIIDPRNKLLEAAREYVMVMSEFDSKDMMKFEAEYYLINGYADQYMKNPLEAGEGELVRMYVINIGTTIPYSFHLHSTIFKAYPSGLVSNTPIDAQTVPVGPGDAIIVEARWKYPGTYLFHSHGMQEERGNMGQIQIIDANFSNENNNSGTVSTSLTDPTTPADMLTFPHVAPEKSISMFDWQYELQKKLQKAKVVEYPDEDLGGADVGARMIGSTHEHESQTRDTNGNETGSVKSANLSNNATTVNATVLGQTVQIVHGASNPNSAKAYEPPTMQIKSGSLVVWVNNDSIMHTATSGNEEKGPSGLFDTGIISDSGKTAEIIINADPGRYDYYCTLHPYMKGQLTVSE